MAEQAAEWAYAAAAEICHGDIDWSAFVHRVPDADYRVSCRTQRKVAQAIAQYAPRPKEEADHGK